MYVVPALLLALTFHEYAHARVAASLGDSTPERERRLTLNPLAHLDPVGTLVLLLAGFGWAKPVGINPFLFRGNRKTGTILVSAAGPGMNLLIALVAAMLLKVLMFTSWGYSSAFGEWAFLFLQSLVLYDVVLALFNLIPVPPLDGSNVLLGLLPDAAGEYFYQIGRYGVFILMVLSLTGVLGRFLFPWSIKLSSLIYQLVGFDSGLFL